MASAIQELLNGFNVTFGFEVLYQPARGTITIEAKSGNMAEHDKFYIPSDFVILTWMSSTNNSYPWRDRQGFVTTVDNNNRHSLNGVLRNSDMIAVSLESEYYKSYESGFIDLLNAHNVYMHCPNLGHCKCIGVRVENTIIKKSTCIFIIRLFNHRFSCGTT